MTASPALTLARVYGDDVVYIGRASWRGYDLLRRGDPWIRESFVGTFATLVGAGTGFCPAGAAGPETVGLIEAARLPFPHSVIRYQDREGFDRELRSLVDRGVTLAFQHVFPPDEIPASACWISPTLLSRLNDKANLAELVPEEACPPRRVLPLQAASALRLPPGETLVIKGSTARSTGSGGAVVIAREESQLRGLPSRLPECEHVVVEEFQPFERTMCVTWAATAEGDLHYVGSADQVVNEDGVFNGSWLGPELPAPRSAIEMGERIMRGAAARGYVGFAGFDMGVLPNGRVLVFDLNFRLCASTPALLWLPVLLERGYGPLFRLATFRSRIGFREMCATAGGLVRAGRLIPLTAFDSSAAGMPEGEPILRGLVPGRNRAEIEERCQEMRRAGLATNL